MTNLKWYHKWYPFANSKKNISVEVVPYMVPFQIRHLGVPYMIPASYRYHLGASLKWYHIWYPYQVWYWYHKVPLGLKGYHIWYQLHLWYKYHMWSEVPHCILIAYMGLFYVTDSNSDIKSTVYPTEYHNPVGSRHENIL